MGGHLSGTFSTAFRLFLVVVLTAYWLVLLKLGHNGIQDNVWELLDQAAGTNNTVVGVSSTTTTVVTSMEEQLPNSNPQNSISAVAEGHVADTKSNQNGLELPRSSSSIRTLRHPQIPLMDLVQTNPNPKCDPGNTQKRLVNHTILDERITHPTNRKIPKIVHLTAKTRCMTPEFEANVQKWRMDGYSVYIHDDAAVKRLLNEVYWPEFPHMNLLTKPRSCLMKGASTADLWRYLVLWEYGGIYADIDSAPGPRLQASITNKDDSYFVVERLGIMSQYFMAGAAKHPYFYLCVMVCLDRLLILINHVGKQNIPVTTGPGVVKVAMIRFMENVDPTGKKYGRISKGIYTGMANRTIKVVGSKAGSGNWVIRESMKRAKQGGYAAMGMKHFSQIRLVGMNASCHGHLYNQYMATQTTGNTIAANYNDTAAWDEEVVVNEGAANDGEDNTSAMLEGEDGLATDES